MPKVRAAGFGVSLDGFSAGTEQSLNDPLGKLGPELFQWFFHTKTFCAMHGQEGGSVDVDDEFARRSMENVGAFILGRNMFGPVRGPWPDSSWKGWWGDNPPYHSPTFAAPTFAARSSPDSYAARALQINAMHYRNSSWPRNPTDQLIIINELVSWCSTWP